MSVLSRRFGRTGWNVSEVAYGAWQLGGQWGPVDDEESIKALLFAYEAGINFVDTAQMYGLGRSEENVGKSIKRFGGGEIKVATKAQPPQWPSVDNPNPKYSDLYPTDYLRSQVEGSLKRLGVDRIDLFQLHCWAPDGLHNRDWLDVLSDFQQQGKIDKIGVSIRDYRPEDGIELAKSGLVDSLQVIYNIFEQEPDKALFAVAEENDIAIIARVVLDSGALSGAWTPETYSWWEKDSVLATMFRGERFEETLSRVAMLKSEIAPFYSSLAEVAVRFVLDQSAVSTAILGMSNARRILENLSYSDNIRLPIELRNELKKHEWRRNYYV